MNTELVDPKEYEQARAQLGPSFVRILSYFREDGTKSVDAIEGAMRDRDSAALVIPAHTIKGESRQFGSRALGTLAEKIEMTARRCVEERTGPEELALDIANLRSCFSLTLAELEKHSVPAQAQSRPNDFGRKAPASLTSITR